MIAERTLYKILNRVVFNALSEVPKSEYEDGGSSKPPSSVGPFERIKSAEVS